MKKAIICLLLLCACSPNSLEDFHQEGQSIVKALTEELRLVQNREDLEKALPVLKKRFESLVDLMIDARKYQLAHPDEEFEETLYAVSLDDELLEEIKRICHLEKGKDLLEQAQREPLLRLDAFQRKRLK